MAKEDLRSPTKGLEVRGKGHVFAFREKGGTSKDFWADVERSKVEKAARGDIPYTGGGQVLGEIRIIRPYKRRCFHQKKGREPTFRDLLPKGNGGRNKAQISREEKNLRENIKRMVGTRIRVRKEH